jgi:hypothetical protein
MNNGGTSRVGRRSAIALVRPPTRIKAQEAVENDRYDFQTGMRRLPAHLDEQANGEETRSSGKPHRNAAPPDKRHDDLQENERIGIMAGRKLFTNKSPCLLLVTLVIRKSADPRDRAGTKDFQLSGGQSQWQEYGDNVDIYLNGIDLTAVANGTMIGNQHFVIVRGSPLDNELNMFNAVDFTFDGLFFYLSARQVN